MMRNTNKSAAVAAVLLAAAMTASACSSSKSTGGSPSTGSTSKSTPKSTVNDINAKDPKTLKQGGTLTLAVTQYSTQWDLDHIDGAEDDTDRVMRTMMPVLFHFDSGGAATTNTDYLVSADVTATPPK